MANNNCVVCGATIPEGRQVCPACQRADPRTIEHPSHYNRAGAMECIDEMIQVFGVEAVKIFCVLNAWKYRYRAPDKGGKQDIEKSDQYMKILKELNDNERH